MQFPLRMKYLLQYFIEKTNSQKLHEHCNTNLSTEDGFLVAQFFENNCLKMNNLFAFLLTHFIGHLFFHFWSYGLNIW